MGFSPHPILAAVLDALDVENSIGGISHLSMRDGENGVPGVPLHHKTSRENPPGTFAITACKTQNVNVTVLPCFGLSEGRCITAKDSWGKIVQLPKGGHFDRENFNSRPSMPSSKGDTHCVAVSASTRVEPHGKCIVAFAVAWSPKIKFLKGKSYHRILWHFLKSSFRFGA